MSIQILNDRNFTAEFISSLSRHGEIPVTVRVKDLTLPSRLSIRYKKKGRLQVLIENEQNFLKENDEVQVSFCLEDTFFKFDTIVIGVLETHCIIEMPGTIHSSYRRLVRRHAISDGEGFAASFLDQVLSPVDISTKGMAFTCDENIFSEGQLVKQLKIKTPDQSEFYIDAEVRHCETSSENKFSYGLMFTEGNLAFYQELCKYILKKTYPDIEPLNAGAQSSIITGFTKFRDGKPVIKGLAKRIYAHTFLGTQLIPVDGIRDMLDSQIILAETVLAHPYFKYYVTYNDADLTLNSIFKEVSNAIADENKMAVETLGLYEFEAGFCDSAYSVMPLESPVEFLNFFDEHVSQLEANCFGYAAKDLGLSAERSLWAVYKGSELSAYAVVEAHNEIVRVYPVGEPVTEELAMIVAAKTQKRKVAARGKGSKTIQMVLMDSEGLSMFKKLLAVNPTQYIKYYPLTYPQKAIWNMEKFYVGTSIGNVAGTIRIKGKANIELLETAINICIAANLALRLRVTEDGATRQYLSQINYRTIDYFDFSQRSTAELYKWDEEQTASPFQLLNSDLFYFAILKISKQSYGFYIKLHHLVSDGWSIVLTASRIMKIYSTLIAENLTVEPRYPSYLNYVIGEGENRMSDTFKKNQEFWNGIFSTMPELTCLKPSPLNFIFTSAQRKTFVLDNVDNLNTFCKATRVSIFALFMATLSVYIYRTTMKRDMVIGMPILNRTGIKEKETVGMFISTMPIRLTLDANMKFCDYADYVSRELSKFMRHENYPYELILEEYRKIHNTTNNLYDLVVSYQNAVFDIEEGGDDYLGRWHFNGNQTEALSLHISDREHDGKFTLNLDYRLDAFADEEIDKLQEHFTTILLDATTNPIKEIKNLKMLSEAEQHKILYEFNNTDMDYPKNKTIHRLFEEQVEKAPDDIAIEFEDRRFTYKELDSQANQIANILLNKGIQSDEVVGIMANRSIEMVAGILGILKAGGAYLPIDPSFPDDRISYMLSNCEARILLVEKHCTPRRYECQIINISNELGSARPNRQDGTKSSDLAYIIYTSGTEYSPKGVMVEHESVVNQITGLVKAFGFNGQNKHIWLAKVAFDVSVQHIFLPLLSGATLFIPSEKTISSPQRLWSFIKDNEIDTINTVPALMDVLLDNTGQISRHNFEFVMVGGDTFNKSLLEKIQKSVDAKNVINIYGPTETTINATVHICEEESVTIPIGKPLSNYKAYILDENMNPLPIGHKGELYIAGCGLARGYIKDLALTDRKFVGNLFSSGKMYKTGDYAKWLSDGSIEHLGRMDTQVKINGVRIELSEIESKLKSLSEVKDAVVILSKEENRKLLAFIVQKGEVKANYRERLLNLLPSYMIPSSFIMLDEMPLTPNGKIDKRALKEKGQNKLHTEAEYSAPTNETENDILTEAQKLLALSSVGVNTNLFDAGLDSLGLIRLAANINKNFKTDISLNFIYKNPTVRAISTYISPVSDQSFCVRKGMVPFAKRIDSLNNIKKLDSAALCYLPEEAEGLIELGNEPFLLSSIETELGNIGLIAIPIFMRELYSRKDYLISVSTSALSMAESLGAKVVSLTGLIPSATSYGQDIQINTANIKITTGHATTSSSVVLTLERMLKESCRNLANETLCVLGAGSIGTAVLELALNVLPHPRSIVLCDVFKKVEFLKEFSKQVQKLTGFSREIKIVYARGQLPFEVYNSSVIIGATNIADILDVDMLMPGTMIIDDSAPHCFSVGKAIHRVEDRGDILFAEGGVLESPHPLTKTLYAFPDLKNDILSKYERSLTKTDEVTGCILSGLLSSKFELLNPTVGKVNACDSLTHYRKLKELEFKGASLHCDNFTLNKAYLESFRTKFANDDFKV